MILKTLCLFLAQPYPACEILAPQPEIEPAPQTVKVQNPSHWTTREFPSCHVNVIAETKSIYSLNNSFVGGTRLPLCAQPFIVTWMRIQSSHEVTAVKGPASRATSHGTGGFAQMSTVTRLPMILSSPQINKHGVRT